MDQEPVQPVVTQDPMAPAAPAPSAAPMAPSTTMPKNSKKGLIGLVIGIVALGVLAVSGAVIYFAFFYVSKADYQHAVAQTNTVINAYNQLSSVSSDYEYTVEDSTATDSMVADKASAYKKTYGEYLASVTALGKERALKNSKVAKAYDQFVAKNTTFTDENVTVEQAMPTLHKIAVNCNGSAIGSMDTSDLSHLVSVYDKAVTPCIDAMKELSNSKNSDISKIGKKAVTYFADMRTHIVNMQDAYIANDRTKFENEYNAFLDKSSSFSSDTDVTNIQKHQDSLAPTKELNNLATVLQSLE